MPPGNGLLLWFTADQQKAIAQAKNINNSDVDLCEFKGKTIIYYSWGNQQAKEFPAEAVYEGTLASFLKGFFPEGREGRFGNEWNGRCGAGQAT